MGLTELFNEWIVERGSAKVQEKHIALFRDQLALADKKLLASETEKAEIAAKLEASESKVKELTKENEILRTKIQEYEKPIEQPKHNDLLDPDKIKLLVFLAQHDWISFDYIPRSLSMNSQVAQFHLDELQESDMVSASYCMGESPEWALAQEGRRFLIKNNLIT